MQVLELFAWTRSIWKVADKFGYQTKSLELDPKFACELTMSVLDFNPDDFPDISPSFIWASPPCTTFSIAAISHHRFPGGAPKSEDAKIWDLLVLKTIDLIRHYSEKNPDLVFFIENPRGYLRKMPFMQGFTRHTVTYCQYGDNRMKPTDIWTNSGSWIPRPICSNGSPCHESAPRGSKTGTQWLKNSALRSVIPEELCIDIVSSFSSDLTKK